MWTIDPAHSEITFAVRHMMISNVTGRFARFEGIVDFNEQEIAESSVAVDIFTDSVSTRDAERDDFLRSADFLDAARYPTMKFVSRRIEMTDETHGRIIGDLTIKDVTCEVVLEAEYNGQSKSPRGTISAGFSAQTKINRKDWDLAWNVALETGGWLVGEEVKIRLEMEVVKQGEAAPA